MTRIALALMTALTLWLLHPSQGRTAESTTEVAAHSIDAAGAPTAPRNVTAHIDLSTQKMEVWVDGWRRYQWPVSTARRGYRTPVGTYRPYRMHRRYFSRKYDNAPMPYAIFFHKGYAIHGTQDLRRLGRPASHGCVRLHPENAATFFTLVSEVGRANTSIIVTR